jgi:hypothetical protein
MAALQPVCDRLRYDMFPPEDKFISQKDYRRSLEDHLFLYCDSRPDCATARWCQMGAA